MMMMMMMMKRCFVNQTSENNKHSD